ncbi:MAG: hypothetical protein IKH12_09270 [Clostridia bacterium]|nr:hypothetical protein [Clostridia bacterium]
MRNAKSGMRLTRSGFEPLPASFSVLLSKQKTNRSLWAVRIGGRAGFSPLFSVRTACPAQGIRQDYPVPGRLFKQKIAGEKLLRIASDTIFAKDKAQGADNPDGYPCPATQYFTNKSAAATARFRIRAALERLGTMARWKGRIRCGSALRLPSSRQGARSSARKTVHRTVFFTRLTRSGFEPLPRSSSLPFSK